MAWLPHDQHRAIGVANDVTGIRAEKIGAQTSPMRTHHDQVSMHCDGLVENFAVDAALPHDARDARCRLSALVGDDRDSLSCAVARCCPSKSGGTYSASIAGVTGSTLMRRTTALLSFAIITALAIAGLASSASARSIGTKML
jgi:hypothetical protein